MKVNTHDMRHKILRVVADEPKTANDDKLLISMVWQMEGWNEERTLFENLKKVSSSETIRRTRQKLVEEGLIKPTTSTTYWRRKAVKQVLSSI